jgi:NO-binding membrane sensor protein with MHYT domain
MEHTMKTAMMFSLTWRPEISGERRGGDWELGGGMGNGMGIWCDVFVSDV